MGAYQPYVPILGRPPAPMVADFRHHMLRKELYVLTTEETGDSGIETVGYIVFYPQDDCMFLENVAVSPAHSNRGFGRQLINYCETTALQDGKSIVRLYTNEMMEENLSMHPHLGYQEIERKQEHGFNRVYFEKHLTAAV